MQGQGAAYIRSCESDGNREVLARRQGRDGFGVEHDSQENRRKRNHRQQNEDELGEENDRRR